MFFVNIRTKRLELQPEAEKEEEVIGGRFYLGWKYRARLSRPSTNPPCYYTLPATRQETYEILFQLSTDIESFNFLPDCRRSGWLDKWTMLQKNLTSHFIQSTIFMNFAFLAGWTDHWPVFSALWWWQYCKMRCTCWWWRSRWRIAWSSHAIL